MMEKTFYTLEQLAKMLGVTQRTITREVKAGKLYEPSRWDVLYASRQKLCRNIYSGKKSNLGMILKSRLHSQGLRADDWYPTHVSSMTTTGDYNMQLILGDGQLL